VTDSPAANGRRPIGAAELLRTVGLMADGPVTWGRPVASSRPGVYVVEWGESLESAPVELTNVGKWLEERPELRLDGRRPTSREVAARLHEFWLPGQTVVYVGMTKLAIGGRVGALYRTPLGARGPHAGGHWLKTLRGLDRARVWWAETDAPEEYEDGLLTAFADSVDASAQAAPRLRDRSLILPFANLGAATGARRDHGLTGYLEARPDILPAAGSRIVDVPEGAAEGAGEERSRPLEARPTRPAAARGPSGPASRFDIDAINALLQSIACRRLVRELSVAEAAAELSAAGLMRGTRAQPVGVLRDLLKQGLIVGGWQDEDRRWSIRCAARD
jgi:hypothetical protein